MASACCRVQLNVKLFVFDQKTQSWLERGLGLLRLNDRSLQSDSDSFQSRLGLLTHLLGSRHIFITSMSIRCRRFTVLSETLDLGSTLDWSIVNLSWCVKTVSMSGDTACPTTCPPLNVVQHKVLFKWNVECKQIGSRTVDEFWMIVQNFVLKSFLAIFGLCGCQDRYRIGPVYLLGRSQEA